MKGFRVASVLRVKPRNPSPPWFPSPLPRVHGVPVTRLICATSSSELLCAAYKDLESPHIRSHLRSRCGFSRLRAITCFPPAIAGYSSPADANVYSKELKLRELLGVQLVLFFSLRRAFMCYFCLLPAASAVALLRAVALCLVVLGHVRERPRC